MHDNFTTQTVQELLCKSQSGGLHDVDDKQQACCSRGAGLPQQHSHQSMTYPSVHRGCFTAETLNVLSRRSILALVHQQVRKGCLVRLERPGCSPSICMPTPS